METALPNILVVVLMMLPRPRQAMSPVVVVSLIPTSIKMGHPITAVTAATVILLFFPFVKKGFTILHI